MVRRTIPSLLSLLILCPAFLTTTHAQDCAPPSISSNPKVYNIFSPEQEMVLGELTYERMSGELRFVRDPEIVAYVDRIGERLTKYLPPTGLKFHFLIVDLSEANAFNVPGGYVFVSRKLIAFANSEDELAGVMAHELGHAVVHHVASNVSELFRKILNVSKVEDRKDITEKYNLLIERFRTKNVTRGIAESEQLDADRIGLYAMVAAGYDPNAFAAFFDRLVETKGKTGSWFSDIFGKARPDQKRLREMIKITEQLPAQCREHRQASASQDFLKWQADVVLYRETIRKEELPGLLWKKELSPRLRSDISHFAFTSDGKYFLAQDDFAITVIRREPLEVAFQILAPDAREASFTADGRFVVFSTENLRYEKWSVAEQKPVQVRELVVRRDCWEHGLSPDGSYLACLDYDLNLNLIETQTGKKVFEKKEFYRLSFFEFLNWITADVRDVDSEQKRFFNIEFSPDSRLLAIARTSRFRYSLRFNGLVAGQSEDTLLALDLTTLKSVKAGGDLKAVTRRAFTFLDANRILGMASEKIEDSGIFSFPEGKRLAKFSFGAEELERTANPNYVIIRPLANAKMGLFDLSRNAIVSASDKVDAAIWGNVLVYESVSGKVLISDTRYDETPKILKTTPITTIDIPVASIGQLYAAELSSNFQWLAVSTKTRGAIWNLASGERKLFVRGFRGALLADDGSGIGEFPKQEPLNHNLALLNPLKNEAKSLREIPEKGANQYGSFLLIRRNPNALPTEVAKDDKTAAGKGVIDPSLRENVRFELRSVVNDKLVWSREFPKEAPRFFFDQFSGRLILFWRLGSEVGKARLKEDADLAARARDLLTVDDDYLIEVVDAFAGKSVGTVLLDTGKHSFYVRSAVSEANWLVLHDSKNRLLVFAFKEGDLRHRFFGARAAINPARNQIVVENYPGELTFYDLATGESQARLSLASAAAFVRFSLDGKKLFVLSGVQTAYTFDVEKLCAKVPTPAE